MRRETLKTSLAVLAAACVVCAGPAVLADWFVGDDYKMHHPQLPDPYGWDVFAGPMFDPDGTGNIIQKTLADDWLCTETGFVSDVHIWGSWKHDDIPLPPNLGIHGVHLSIHADVPAGADPNPDINWSHPGRLLWDMDFPESELRIIDYGTGQQGWYNPNTGEYIPEDHRQFHQINIVDIPDPFIQDEGTIYWLDVTVFTDPVEPGTDGPQWGWKTSRSHFMDDAVWTDDDPVAGIPVHWNELRDPYTGESLDLAFVITGEPIPEPAGCVLVLMGLGGLALVTRRFRR